MRVIILERFTGYPEQEVGKDEKGNLIVVKDGPAVTYAPDKNETPIEVPDEFGKMIVAKGHAREAGAQAQPAATEDAVPARRRGNA